MIAANANIASGCIDHEAWKSPFVIKLMDLPNPQPGHQSNPRLLSGHKVKCWEP